MQAVRLHEAGGPEKLVLEEVQAPEAGAGDALVRVRAAALNHRDLFITRGLYPNITLPRILGSDCGGTLDDADVVVDPAIGWGENERVWSPDATILGMPRDGTFAQYVAVPKENVYPKPAHLSMEEAAALPLGGLTAYRALFARGCLQAGETVLITGVGGGVQTFALLFAKTAGARVVVTSSRDGKLERAKALGADVAINYATTPDWHKAVRAAVGAVDIAVDSAGGDTFAKALTVVRPGGRIVTYGGTSGEVPLKMFPVFWNQISILGTSMGSPTDFKKMLHFVTEHKIAPVIDRVYDLAEIRTAMERMDDALQFGKIVLRVP
jgi:zinc-binding alcohol dehydrogenase/oxidoreductase